MRTGRCARKVRSGRALRALALATVIGLLRAGVARAETCPGDTPALRVVPAERRIAFIAERLDAERSAAQAWSWTWGLTNAALAVGQLAAIPAVSSRDGRILLGVGAGLSAAAVAQILALPIVVERPLAAGASPAVGTTSCPALSRAERSLERAARHEGLGSGAAAHVANLVVNAGFATAVGATDRWSSGALAFALGFALGEAQILTEPRGAIADLERYRSGDLSPRASAARWRPGVFAVRRGGGVTLALRF